MKQFIGYKSSYLYTIILLVSSSISLAASGNGPGAGGTETVIPDSAPQPMEQNMFGGSEGKPDIAGDGIQNATGAIPFSGQNPLRFL